MWKRLREAGEIALVLLWLPFFVAVVVIPRQALEAYRLSLSRNRLAVRLARKEFASRHPEREVEFVNIADVTRQRCYVVLTHQCQFHPPTQTLYAVWFSTGEVREVVTTQFHWGITPSPFIQEFEDAISTGSGGPEARPLAVALGGGVIAFQPVASREGGPAGTDC